MTNFEDQQQRWVSELLARLSEIENQLQSMPNPYRFKSNNEFMRYLVELMTFTLDLLKICPQLAPTPDTAIKGFTKHKAIVVGHLVRAAKLYEGLLMHVCENQLELAAIFYRDWYMRRL